MVLYEYVLCYQVKPSKDNWHKETGEKYCDGEGIPLMIGLRIVLELNMTSLVILQSSVQIHAKESSDKHS